MSGLFSRRSAGQALLDCDVHCLDGSVFQVVLSVSPGTSPPGPCTTHLAYPPPAQLLQRRATGQELLLQAFRHLKIQDATCLGLVFAGESGQQVRPRVHG